MQALLTIDRAAQVLGISPWTVRRYIAVKKILPVRIGRRVLVEESELQRIIEVGRSQHPRNDRNCQLRIEVADDRPASQ